MFYSGPEIKIGWCGTSFIFSSKVKCTNFWFESLGDRLCKLRIKGRFRNLSLISEYAPMEDTSDTRRINSITNYTKNAARYLNMIRWFFSEISTQKQAERISYNTYNQQKAKQRIIR